jgi:hypothetical protein
MILAVPLAIFEDSTWQMSLGERAAVEGVLAELRPSLALEIGSMEGACLRHIAAHAEEAHSFDLNPPTLEMPANVTLHTGDSHELLPPFLASLAEQDRNVDFAIVDGDHSPQGVRRDIEDLLDSRALARSVILIHDTANERVRRGVDAVRFAAWPKVTHVELDWIPGQLFAEPALRNELWFGLGLVLVDSSQPAYTNGRVFEQRYHPAGPLLAEIRELVLERERSLSGAEAPGDDAAQQRKRVADLRAELNAMRTRAAELQAELVPLRDREQRAQRTIQNITGSASWRMTEPVRSAKRRLKRLKP